MQREHIVKFDGHAYSISGSFSFGSFDAVKKALAQHSPNFEAIPGGQHCGADKEGRTLWKFEAIDHTAQQGLTVWVHSA